MSQNVFTTKQATEYLKISKKTLYRLINSGRVRATKAGKDYRFLRSELDRFLRGETTEPKAVAK